jgi:hypothetical protein
VHRVRAELVAGAFIIVVAMVVAMRAVHVLVRDFFFGCGAHVDHRQLEAQGHAGQRVIAVEDDLVVGDVGHGEDHRAFVVGAVGHAFELHAHFQRLRQAVARLHFHQRRIVVAERIVRLDLDGRRVADFLAVELFFNLRQRVLVAAMQVDHGLTAVFDQVVLCVRQLVVDRDYCVLGNLHSAFLSLF